MRQYQATWNGTQSQARAMVEAWKIEQQEKQRKQKMAAYFSRVKMEEARAIVKNNF